MFTKSSLCQEVYNVKKMDRYDTVLDSTSSLKHVLSTSDEELKAKCSLLAARKYWSDLLNSRKIG